MEIIRKDLGDDHALSFKQLKKKQSGLELKVWTIYLWKQDVWRGAAAIVLKDGYKGIYHSQGWMSDDPTRSEKKQEWIAKNECKKELTNLMNALNWYGKEILDDKGNIDPNKFYAKEAHTAYLAKKQKVDMEDLYKIRKFPSKVITYEEARELQLI